VANNGAAIAEVLLESERPVLLISHSKGTVDSMDALLNAPQARKKVAAWFSLQGAVGGSILADVLGLGWKRSVVGELLKKYGGNLESLDDLRTSSRQAYLASHAAEIAALVEEVPVISFASTKKFEELTPSLRRLVWAFEPDYQERVGDGLVELKNAFIPGAPYVVMRGVDHVETIYRGPQALDRARFFRAVLVMLEARAMTKK
jgi:triacylglycerol esterase/lipase EstA (alpha/beta hydrolase family)